MFTEGLDESAISWIKQGTDSPAPAPPRSPLVERLPAGQLGAALPPRSPLLHSKVCGAAAAGFFSPKGLPPVKTTSARSGLLGRHSVLLSAAGSDDEWDGEERESVASWGLTEDRYGGNCFSETADEDDGACSSDSSLLRRAMDRCGSGWDDEVTSQLSRKTGGGGIVRGQSKEFLRVDVRPPSAFAARKCSGGQDPVDSTSHVRLLQFEIMRFCFLHEHLLLFSSVNPHFN